VLTPLRSSLAAIVVSSAFLFGCRPAATQPPRPEPVAAPDSWSFDTQDERDEARDAALAAAHWLLTTHPPSAHSKTWIRARDFALDWIEADGEPQVVVNVPLVAWMSKDLRYVYSIYNLMAYQCGKAIYLATESNPDPMQAEVAGVLGALTLYDVFRASERGARSKKLERLRRKHARGRLEGFIAKKFGLPPAPPEPSPPAPASPARASEAAPDEDPADEGATEETASVQDSDSPEDPAGDEGTPEASDEDENATDAPVGDNPADESPDP
jgi:hypothetical protein